MTSKEEMLSRVALVVLRDDPNDGRLKRQVDSLKAASFDVKVFPVLSDTPGHKWLTPFSRPLAYRWRRRRTVRQLKQFDPHLVISHEPEALSVTGHFLAKHDRPHIYDAHEYYEGQRGVTDARKAWLKKTYDQHAHTIDAMITVSPGMIELYSNTHPLLPRAVLIANAANASDMAPYDGRLHLEIGVPLSTNILLYQGGMWHGRGIEDVIQASLLLPKDWVTVFMGYGPMKGRLPKSNRLFIVNTKPQEELLQWTAGATLGVIPYPDNSINHTHCLPNKVWEFPQARVPLLARELKDLSHFVKKHNIGLTYPIDGTGADIAKAIAGLSQEDFETLKDNCRKFATIENWQKYEKVYLKLVRDLIGA